MHTGRGRFAVLRAGSAPDPTAVLVPGFTGSKEDFLAVLAPLAEAGFHVVAVDLAGQYETPPPSSGTYSLTGFADDLLAVAAAVSGRPVHVVGHSFGGLVVREAVLSRPDRFASATLMSSGPAAIPDRQAQRLQLFAHVLREQGQDVVWAAKRALEEEEGSWVAVPPDVDRFLTERFLANDPASLLAMLDVLTSEPDRVAELAAVTTPTLVVTGADDDAWAPSVQRDMADRLGAHAVVIDGAGHSPAVDRPEETAAALVEHWRRR